MCGDTVSYAVSGLPVGITSKEHPESRDQRFSLGMVGASDATVETIIAESVICKPFLGSNLRIFA